MSLDYPNYEEMIRRGSRGRWFWPIGDWMYYLGILLGLIWPMGAVSKWINNPLIPVWPFVLVWLGLVALIPLGLHLKKLAYHIAEKEGIDFSNAYPVKEDPST